MLLIHSCELFFQNINISHTYSRHNIVKIKIFSYFSKFQHFSFYKTDYSGGGGNEVHFEKGKPSKLIQ